MPSLQLRIKQPDAFIPAIKEWLSGEVTGHLGSFMYADDVDDHRWKDGHSSESYYVGIDEKNTFNLAVNDLGIQAENFIDLGPSGTKAVRTKGARLAGSVQAQNYFPVDLSTTLANQAAAEMKLPGHAIITNFFEPVVFNKTNSLISILGLTLGNLETHASPLQLHSRLQNIFSTYRNMVSGKSYLLISIDANNNAQQIIDCYANKEFGGLIRSCVERAIDISNFDYYVVWTPHNYQLATGLRAQRDQIIKFDGEEFAIEQGEFLPVLNSYRYPVAFVTEAATKAGWPHQKTWSATGRVHYMLFKADIF